MCLRERLLRRLKSLRDRLSGDYSAADTGAAQPYDRGLGEDPTLTTRRARIPRPTDARRPPAEGERQAPQESRCST